MTNVNITEQNTNVTVQDTGERIVVTEEVINVATVGTQGPAGPGSVWGDITGTLSDQTDLQAALDAKGGGTMKIVKSNGTQIGGADIITLNFDSLFSISESPNTEIDITLENEVIDTTYLAAGAVTPIKLENGTASPGNSKYYGTNGSGTNGFFDLPDSAIWGSIAGTLSAQSDLQAALDTKVITASNIGSGEPIFKQKTGTTLEFLNLTAASNKTIVAQLGDNIEFDVDEANLDIGNMIGSITTSRVSDFDTGVNSNTNVVANTAKNSYPPGDQAKMGYLTVTQDVNLDQMKTDIAALANGMVYKGDWDASAGTFPSGADTGWFYYVSVAGTVDSVSFDVGDNLVAITDGASTSTYAANWSKHDQTAAVQSVAGKTGAVTLVEADITDLQNYSLMGHTHTESDITDLQAYLTAEVNDLTSAVTWADVPDVNITESSVTQHEAALTITESQISDLAHTTDHGILSGLGDDDHTQYLLADGTRLLTGDWDVGAFTVTAQNVTVDSITAGSVLFAGAGGAINQDNSNLFWDNTNKELGIGTSPDSSLHVVGTRIKVENTGLGCAFVMNRTDGAAAALHGGGSTANFLFDENFDFRIKSGTRANVEIGSGTGDTRLHINGSDGFVGILETSPATELDVNGDISVGGSNNELRFYEGSNYVGFEAPALSANQIWVLPNTDGSTDQVLKTDGSGNLGWVKKNYTVIWAEESGALTAGTNLQFSFGNGGTGNYGIRQAFSGKIYAMSINVDTDTATADTGQVDISINNSPQGGEYHVGNPGSSNGGSTVVFITPLSFSAGDRLSFDTTVTPTGGTTTDIVMSMWIIYD